MNEYELIKFLFHLGHLYSPGAIAVALVEEKDLPKLKLTDKVIRAGIASYQRWFKADLDRLALRSPEKGGHHRLACNDGEAGPCTFALMDLPRCGFPDYLHPEATQQANWPDQCRMEITTSFKMQLDGVSQSELEKLWVEGDRNWEKALEVGFRFENDKYPNTRFHAQAERMQGGILAWHQLAVNNCNAELPGAYNSNVNWAGPLLVTTITHEHGHGLGFQHVQDNKATMYPSITSTSMDRRGYPNRSDIAEAKRNGYRERTSPPPPDDDDDDNPPPPGTFRRILESESPIRDVF